MKKTLILGAFLVGFCSFQNPSFKDGIKEDLKALAAEEAVLDKKVDSLANSATAVNKRIEKVNRMAEQKNQTAANLVPVFQKECDYLNGVLEKAQSLKKSVDDQLAIIKQTDKDINKDMSNTDAERLAFLKELDQIGMKNSLSNDKIKEVINAFTGHRDRVCKMLKKLQKKAEN